MRKLKVLFITISFFLIAANLLDPGPYGIALNLAEMQCAGYWSGDEYVSYDLPYGWTSYEFQYSEDYVTAETDIGTCQVAKDQVVGFDYEKPCCSQLGYAFVSENIGVRGITSDGLTQTAEMEKTANYGDHAQSSGYFELALSFGVYITLAVLVLMFLRVKRKA